MVELIDRKRLIKSIKALPDCENGYSDTYDKACIIGMIEEEPTVEPVRRGHWIIDRKFGNDVMSGGEMVICSECGEGFFWGKPNYCPNCGTRMDEVNDE